jgi:hypothetical protein
MRPVWGRVLAVVLGGGIPERGSGGGGVQGKEGGGGLFVRWVTGVYGHHEVRFNFCKVKRKKIGSIFRGLHL